MLKESQLEFTVQCELMMFELRFILLLSIVNILESQQASRFFDAIKTLHLNHDGVEQTFIRAKRENEIFNNHSGGRMNKVMCTACLRYEILLRILLVLHSTKHIFH